MSYKSTVFSHTLSPKTASRFLVVVPGIVNSPIRVYKTTMPQDKLDTISLPVAGQKIVMPGKTQFNNTWSCTAYESLLMDLSVQIRYLKMMQSNFMNQFESSNHLIDIKTVVSPDVATLLQNLSTYTTLENDSGSFGVNLLEPLIILTDEATGLIPIRIKQLKGAFLTGVNEYNLDWGSPASPISYELNFSYSYLRDIL